MNILRRLILVAAIPLMIFGGATAASAHPAQRQQAPAVTCTFLAKAARGVAGVTAWSRVWVSSSTCQNHKPRWPEFYNRTRCVGPRDQVAWRNGPARYGDGTGGSNYSQVLCGGGFAVNQVWIEYYAGAGWRARRLI